MALTEAVINKVSKKYFFTFILLLFSLAGGSSVALGLETAETSEIKHPISSDKFNSQSNIKYPRFIFLVGDVKKENSDGEWLPLKMNDVLVEKANIKTGVQGMLRIELSEFSSLTLFGSSVLKIPVIKIGSGSDKIEFVELQEGELRYSNEAKSSQASQIRQLRIETQLSKTELQTGDFLVSYNSQQPSVQLFVKQGKVLFKGLENEEEILVEEGMKTTFVGKMEDGTVSYDILLRGKKVAKGKLASLEKISEIEMKKYFSEDERKKIQAKQVKPIPRTEKQICDKPYAEYNQCAWSCELFQNEKKASKAVAVALSNSKTLRCYGSLPITGRCVRKKCNANGEWSDFYTYPLGGGPCEKKVKVGKCEN